MLDTLVKVLRFTHNPVVLRKALKILTLVATSIPVKIFLQKLLNFLGSSCISIYVFIYFYG